MACWQVSWQGLAGGRPPDHQVRGPHAETALVILSPGDGHSTIRWTLKRAGVIRELYHYDAARILAGKSFVPKEGEYQIPPAASIEQVMAILHAGAVISGG